MKTFNVDSVTCKRFPACDKVDQPWVEATGFCRDCVDPARLKDTIEYWQKDSATAWNKCEEHRLVREKMRWALRGLDKELKNPSPKYRETAAFLREMYVMPALKVENVDERCFCGEPFCCECGEDS